MKRSPIAAVLVGLLVLAAAALTSIPASAQAKIGSAYSFTKVQPRIGTAYSRTVVQPRIGTAYSRTVVRPRIGPAYNVPPLQRPSALSLQPRTQIGAVTYGRNAVRTPTGVMHNSCRNMPYGVLCGGTPTPYGARSNRCIPTAYGLRCF